MKGQISRDSHRPAERYSGVYHVQGGMITDADLDERTDIVKARTDALGDDAVKDGCPAIGGAVFLSGGAPALREGDVYADGVRGALRLTGTGPAASLADAIARQVDFPGAPALSSGQRVIYADIWERPVFALEDPYLADPGLHGAETAYRSRTMCQIKHAPLAHAGDIEAGTGRYPLIGTATLAVAERDPATTVDECDPCADVVSADLTVSNTLWRLEVVRVAGPADAPTRVDLAWSAENASAIAPASTPSDVFERAGAVYERFSTETECHMGALSDSAAFSNSTFTDDLDAGGTGGMPFIRRWDGHVRLDMTANSATPLGAGFTVSFDGTDMVLAIDEFEATLTIGGRSVLRGDYWLVELRTFAPATERIRLVSPTPVGIEHHHCVLFRANGGAGETLTDAERRKVSFPALSDLPADHVGFANRCEKLYNDAENVQEALDELCSISADDIAFDNNCPRLYDGADTVQEALDNLCKVDFNIETVLRLLMDWGVVCGLTVRGGNGGDPNISIAPGWFLDRGGRLAEFDGAKIDIRKLLEEMSDEARKRMIELLRKEGACLTVALDEDRRARLHLVPSDEAFGPADPGLIEVVRACIEGKKRLDARTDLERLSERDRKTVMKMAMVATNPEAFGGAQRMTRTEERAAKRYTDALARKFEETAEEEEKAALRERLKELDDDFERETAVDSALEARRAIYVANRLVAILESDQERAKRCLCLGMFPACPPELGRPPFHVPLAGIQGVAEGDGFFLKICMFTCRKQAMTWRSVNYVIKDWRERLARNLARYCCAEEKTDLRDDGMRKKAFTYDPELGTKPLAEMMRANRILDGVVGEGINLDETFVAKPDIGDLSVDSARDALSGRGAEVVESIDISDADAVDKIVARAGDDALSILGGKPEFAPGDKVAVLTQGGKARGYVVLERGAGRYVFPTESEKRRVARPGGAAGGAGAVEIDEDRVRRLSELADKLKTVGESEGRIETEIEELAKVRDTLRADVDRLKEETVELDRARVRARTELDAAGQDLRKLVDAQRETMATIGRAREEMKAAEVEHARMIETVRASQPVSSLGISETAKRRFAANNVVTVEEALKRPEASGLSGRQLTALRNRLGNFVKTGRR